MKEHPTRICPTFLLTIAAAVLLAAASVAAASEPAPALFDYVDGPTPGALAGPALVAARRIAIDREALIDAAPELEIELLDGARYRARLTDFERRGAGGVSWWGRLDEPAGGRVILVLENGFVAGTIFAPAGIHSTGVYKVAPLRDGGQALVAIEPGLFPPCEGGLEPPVDVSGERSPRAAPATAEKGGIVDIDVMSLYTPQAMAAAGGAAQIEAEIQAGVNEANVAFLDSEMSARFHLVHSGPANRNDSGNQSADLEWLTGDPAVALLRDAAAADMVSLITNSGCGIAWVMRNPGPGFESFAFQVTGRGCLVGNLTYAHEHGHNMGFEHDPANGTPPSNASYPWSYGRFVDGVYRTVMSYSNQCALGCGRRPHFSNPDVLEQGSPTGIAEQRDNHRTGNLTAPIVRDFRIAVPLFADGFESGDASAW